jgi:His-Xaa-Ser system radical SAM maturase HxsC
VCRVATQPGGAHDAVAKQGADGVQLKGGEWSARILGADVADLAGDVLLLQPSRNLARRLVRSRSKHNTFLVTEQCDQLCVMCSQPPRKSHVDQFEHYKTAAVLAPRDAILGITGGEPTLHKDALFDLISFALRLRDDIGFHVLTNAQHFTPDDIAFLSSEYGRRVLWGVPLYATDAVLHDEIVGKQGAHSGLMDGLSILCRAGAPTELRTVVMRNNARALPDVARFVTRNVPFVRPWAIMQLEAIGFAKNRWADLFFDHSADFAPIGEAIEIARMGGVQALLYNFPLCTVPRSYRRLAPPTISDWKRRYEKVCSECIARPYCSGFFEWHPRGGSYQALGQL